MYWLSFALQWRVTHLFVRMLIKFCIPGVKMMILVLLSGIVVKCYPKLEHSLSTCTFCLLPHFFIGISILGKHKINVSWQYVLFLLIELRGYGNWECYLIYSKLALDYFEVHLITCIAYHTQCCISVTFISIVGKEIFGVKFPSK